MKEPFESTDILHAMPCGCIAFDDNGVVEFINVTLCDLLNYNQKELLNYSIENIFPVSSRIFYQTQLYPLIRLKGSVNEIFLTLKSREGAHIPVRVNVKRMLINDKICNLCVFVTVWEWQKHEQELSVAKELRQQTAEENEILNRLKNELETRHEQLDRQITILTQRNQEYVQLSKVLSHDIQEPIRKVSIFTDMLIQQKKEEYSPELLSKIEKIRNSVLRLQYLTSSLRQYVFVDTDEENSTLLPGNKLIDEAKYEASTALQFHDFELQVAEIPAFEGKFSQVKLLFAELLKNAIQNRKPDQLLLIGIKAVIIEENSYQVSKGKYKYTDHIKLEISDNGVGFDNQYSTYVFGLFNKLQVLSERAGLGLALCKQIVAHHFGTIAMSSEIGKGSAVTIILPVEQPQQI